MSLGCQDIEEKHITEVHSPSAAVVIGAHGKAFRYSMIGVPKTATGHTQRLMIICCACYVIRDIYFPVSQPRKLHNHQTFAKPLWCFVVVVRSALKVCDGRRAVETSCYECDDELCVLLM